MWCWWCCHPIHGESLALPFKYDSRLDSFKSKGFFCSWECMRTYVLNETETDKYVMLIMLRRQKMGMKKHNIKRAPPRQALKVFGGTLSIEEFREGSDNYWVNIPGESILIQSLEPRKKRVMEAPTIERKKQHMTDINNAYQTSNNTLKLKRPVKGGIASLESLMNITRKKNNV